MKFVIFQILGPVSAFFLSKAMTEAGVPFRFTLALIIVVWFFGFSLWTFLEWALSVNGGPLS